MTNTTAHYGWPYPTGSDKAKDLPAHIETLAQSIENTMRGATIPPTANADVRAVASVAARNAYFGAPSTTAAQLALQARGPLAIRTDLGIIEQYFAAKSVSNPQGKPTAGWYQIGGGQDTRPVAGSISSRDVVAQGATTVDIVFPAGRFENPPAVVATVRGAARDTTVNVQSVSTTGATILLASNSSVTRNIGAEWIACDK